MAEKAKEKVKAVREKSSGFRKEFIEFINRGSVVDLAVGVTVGVAFQKIVQSLVDDIIMPIVGLIGGGVNFTNLSLTIPNFFGTGDEAVIKYGNFIQTTVQFLIIAFVIFMVIKGMNRINRLRDRKTEATKDDGKKADDKKASAKK